MRIVPSLLASFAVAFVSTATPALAQTKGTYRTVEPNPVPYDKVDTWTMNLAYYPPRIVEFEVAGKGKKMVWYMPFEIWNKTGSPQLIVPEFTLVSKDLNMPGSYLDEPVPGLLKQIIAIEDPKNLLEYKSVMSLMKDKIPVTKPDSVPNAVRGIAIWTNVPEKASTINKFSIYAEGLSNGLYESLTESGATIVRRKALQLDFVKPTDNRIIKMDDIKIDDNNGLGSEKWYYRSAGKRSSEAKTEEKK